MSRRRIPLHRRHASRRRPMRAPIYLALAALLAALAMALLAWARPFTGATADAGSAAVGEAAMAVTQAHARVQRWPRTLTAVGPVVAWHESLLGAPVDGLRLVAIDVDIGERVRRGQVLARFDDAVLRAERARLQAQLAQALAQAGESHANADRARRLRSSGALSEQSILQATTRATVEAAAARSAQAALGSLDVQLAQTVMRAPDDGTISAREASLGAVPERGQTLFRLVRQDRLEWRGDLAAEQLAQVRPGQAVDLRLPDGGQAQATVRRLAPGLDERSRLGRVHADIRPGSSASAGMFAEGAIVQAPSPALVVPAASLVVRDGRSLVFELQSAGPRSKVGAREVHAGRRLGTEVEVVEGLAPGARIVASGAGLLADGDVVEIVASAAAPHEGPSSHVRSGPAQP